MNRQSLGALVALNIVLLLALVVVSLTPAKVNAQPFGGGAAQYVMLAGEVTGQKNMNAIYITELVSARMIVVMFNGGNKDFKAIAARELKTDVNAKLKGR